MITRRQFLSRGAAGAAVLGAPTALLASPAPAAEMPNLRRWAVPCPTPGPAWPVIDLRTSPATTLDLRQFQVTVHPDLPPTTVWGYQPAGGQLPGAPPTWARRSSHGVARRWT